MNDFKQKELAEEWIKKSKRYILISRLAQYGTITLGTTAMITPFYGGSFKLVFLGAMLITLSQVWVIVGSEWKDKKAAWENLLLAHENEYRK